MTKVERKSLLTLIELLPIEKRKPRKGLYRCVCGNIKAIREHEVRTLKVLSCGCLISKTQKELHLTHGLSKHPLYGVWKAMVDRCHNPGNKQFPDYGALGIVVCEVWRNDFVSFYDWCLNNGWKRGLHLDKDYIPMKRGEKPKLYSPETCCFLVRKRNNAHKKNSIMVEFNGVMISLVEVAEKYGLRPRFVRGRMKKFNWDLNKALITPKGAHKFKKKSNGDNDYG